MSSPEDVNLPYFDRIIENYDDQEVSRAFGEHCHWGYWEDPSTASDDANEFFEAAERLTRKLTDTVNIQNGESVLDVGCGFGGTISSLNERFSDLEITGLNIDQRQLDIAEKRLTAKSGNVLQFVCGDAVNLPFEDNSFDVILAVECIFHFSSREEFLKEVSRVLKPGGRIAFSDFVPAGSSGVFESVVNFFLKDLARMTYGDISMTTKGSYKKLSAGSGLQTFDVLDVSRNVFPTYAYIRQLSKISEKREVRKTNNFMELSARFGLLRYLLFSSVKK